MNSRHRPVIYSILGAAAATLLVALAALWAQTYALTSQIRTTQKSSVSVLSLVQSCTTPGKSCYERGKRQTAGAVADINKVVILAAACASGQPHGLSVEQRQTAIQTCVIQRLAKHP